MARSLSTCTSSESESFESPGLTSLSIASRAFSCEYTILICKTNRTTNPISLIRCQTEQNRVYYHIKFVPRFVVIWFNSLCWILLPLSILSRDFTSDLTLLLVVFVSYRWESFLWCEENIQKATSSWVAQIKLASSTYCIYAYWESHNYYYKNRRTKGVLFCLCALLRFHFFSLIRIT